MMEWIRFALVALLLLGMLVLVFLALTGVFRFHFVLNRMHAAGMLDTGAVLLACVAVVVAHGIHIADLKLLMLLLVLWVGSPISSHMLSRLEVMTDPDLSHHLKMEEKEATKDDNA